MDELKIKLNEAYAEFYKIKTDIIVGYLKENNPHKVGDIIQDHIGYLKIERIKYRAWESEPECVFYGVELKKDLTPMKKQSKRGVYQSNIITNE